MIPRNCIEKISVFAPFSCHSALYNREQFLLFLKSRYLRLFLKKKFLDGILEGWRRKIYVKSETSYFFFQFESTVCQVSMVCKWNMSIRYSFFCQIFVLFFLCKFCIISKSQYVYVTQNSFNSQIARFISIFREKF